MINKKFLQELHNKEIINKNSVLWWQLGYEKRKIYEEKAFQKNLKNVSYDVDIYDNDLEPISKERQSFDVWTKDDVPILIRDINLGDTNYPSFISVKPMSHKDRGGDGWKSLKSNKDKFLKILPSPQQADGVFG